MDASLVRGWETGGRFSFVLVCFDLLAMPQVYPGKVKRQSHGERLRLEFTG
jgi:hypothetical protein